MEFDRQRRLAGLWNWLPVFRAAAEYESLQRAALAMAISPSAVSRTIRLLEAALGFAVFERSSTGVRLTENGAELLKATRDAMRRVDDALAPIAPGHRVGAVAPFLPALVVRVAGPELAALAVVDGDEAASALFRGDVDLVFTHQADESTELVSQRLGELRLVVTRGERAGLVAPSLLEVGDAPGPVTRIDDLSAMLAAATARNLSVLVPRVLAPPGVAHQPHSATLPVFAVSRRPLSGTLELPAYTGALAELF